MANSQLRRGIQRAIEAVEDFRARGHRGLAADVIDGLDSVLRRLDSEHLDNGGVGALTASLREAIDRVERVAAGLVPDVRGGIEDLLARARHIERQLAPSLELPSRPLLGVLPLARVIPQSVHSMMDYSGGLTTLAPVFFAERPEARYASVALGASVIAASAMTDYRLSLVKLIPIEGHEVLDYLWGAAAIAAPFALGYYKRDPLAAALHVITGASTILASLFTDYRAAVGRGHSAVADAAMMGTRVQPGLSAQADL